MPVMEIRTRVNLRKGKKLVFDPSIATFASEDANFFKKYAGMKVKILGFDVNTPTVFEMMAKEPGSKLPKRRPERIFVEFENGDKPSFSLYYVHFRLP